MTEEPQIKLHSDGAVTFTGREAIELYRAVLLRSALRLLKNHIRPTKKLSLTQALRMASKYTGQTYKITEADRARADLQVWIETMKSTLPTTFVERS